MDLVTFTEEIVNRKLHFLRSGIRTELLIELHGTASEFNINK